MSAKFELTAEPRTTGTHGDTRRLRYAGKIPAVIYGSKKEPTHITLDHNSFYNHLKHERFQTSILTIKRGGESDQAILRDVQMHPFRKQILHADFQRISATEKIHMTVPLHFLGEKEAPGVKLEGGVVAHLMNEVDVTCLPADLPEYLEVDMSQMHINQSVHLSNIKLPNGVVISHVAHKGEDLAVAAISAIREIVEEAPVVQAAAEGEAAAGATAEAGAPAADAKAGDAKTKAPADAKGAAAPKAAAPESKGKK